MTTGAGVSHGKTMKASLRFFDWQSLRTRLTIGVLIVSLAVLWATALALSQSLRRDMEDHFGAAVLDRSALQVDRPLRPRADDVAESIAGKLSRKP